MANSPIVADPLCPSRESPSPPPGTCPHSSGRHTEPNPTPPSCGFAAHCDWSLVDLGLSSSYRPGMEARVLALGIVRELAWPSLYRYVQSATVASRTRSIFNNTQFASLGIWMLVHQHLHLYFLILFIFLCNRKGAA